MRTKKKIYSYSVRISDEELELNGVLYSKMVRVSFRDKAKNLIEKKKMPHINLDDLYETIHQGGDINISNCYLDDFNINDYRKRYGISDKEVVILNNFNAEGAIFESDKIVDFTNVKFNGATCSFHQVIFGKGNVSFVKAFFDNKVVDFSNSSWTEGFNNFQFSNFNNADLLFSDSDFISGNISFVNAFFGNGKVDFKNTDFGDGDVSFRFSEFGTGRVVFDHAIFGGTETNFSKVHFGKGRVDFRRTDFGNSEVIFEEVFHDNEKFLFKRCKFGDRDILFSKIEASKSEFLFDEAIFGNGKITFFNSEIRLISFKSCILSNYADFRVKSCETLDLTDTVVQNIVDFNKGLSEVKIETLYLVGVRNLGKFFISWGDNDVYKMIHRQKNSSYSQKANQFRLLKEDFHSAGQYEDEDASYVSFKRYELKHMLELSRKDGFFKKISAWMSYGFQNIFFDKMGLYATSPLRVFLSLFVVYGCFSVLLLVFHILNWGQISCIPDNAPFFDTIIDSFYFTAVTFLTIGYGECVPLGGLKEMAPIVGFSGVFMMSYFTVSFVRKVLR